MSVSSSIFRARARLGLEQRELGDMLGVSDATVSQWENDRRRVSPTRVLPLARALGLDERRFLSLWLRERTNELRARAESF